MLYAHQYCVHVCPGKERLAEILNVEASCARDLTNSFLCEFPNLAVVQLFMSSLLQQSFLE